MIRDRLLVVICHLLALRLVRISQKSRPVQRSCETRSNVENLLRHAGNVGEGAGVAREDVDSGGFAERTDVGEGQLSIGDAAFDVPPCVLGIDSEIFLGILVPALVHVGLEVVVEQPRDEHGAGIRAERTEVLPRLVLDHQLVPSLPIFLALADEPGADVSEALRREARYLCLCSRRILKLDGNGQADEVYE